jgi:hypothetical protein
MINPYKLYGPFQGVIESIESQGVKGFVIKSKGTLFTGYDLPKRFVVGDKVTFRAMFNIALDRFVVDPDSVRRKRQPKPKIVILNKYTDSFGTLHVEFIGHDGERKYVYFDEGEHAQFERMKA